MRRIVAGVLAMAALVAALALVEGAMTDDALAEDTLPEFDELWNFGDPAGTEAKFRELLPRAREAGNPGYLAELLSQIGRTRGLQRDFDGAHEILDEAESVATPECTTARVRIWLERGRTFNSSGQKEKAWPLFLKAFVTSHKAGDIDGLMIDALHMFAFVVDPEDGLQWNELAIDLAEKSDDPKAKRWLGSLYNNTGWSYHEKGDYETALDFWERQVTWFEGRAEKGRGLLIAKWTVARGLRSMKRYDDALERQRALLAEYEAQELEEAGYCAEEMGENLLALERVDEAQPWFAQAYAKLSKDPWLAANEAERLERMKKLAGPEGDEK